MKNLIQINKPGNSTIVLVAINTGAFNEVESYKGVSHFLEHILFKGNKKRNQKQISSAIDNVGGDINAYTDSEITAYWAKVGNSYKDLAIDVITDLATKPIFPCKEIDKEREVIIQELKMYEDNPLSYPYEIFNKTLYAKQSGFYLPVLGTKETLYNIERDDLIKYHKEKYNNPTLIIIGNVENKVDIKNSYDIKYIPSELANNPKDKLVERDNLTQANILIGNSVNLTSIKKEEVAFAFKLLDAIYGDMSGRLFDSIREKNNLVYRVRFEHDQYSNGSIQWVVSMGLDRDKIDKARDLAIKELTRPITKKDLKIALIKAIGVEEMALDNIIVMCNRTAFSLVQGIDYRELLFNYKKGLENAVDLVNGLIETMKFNDNILVGIVPTKE